MLIMVYRNWLSKIWLDKKLINFFWLEMFFYVLENGRRKLSFQNWDSIYFITLKILLFEICVQFAFQHKCNNEQIWHAKNWTIWLIFVNVIYWIWGGKKSYYLEFPNLWPCIKPFSKFVLPIDYHGYMY